MDHEAFKLDINDTIVGKPGQYTYDLLDRKNSFKLSPKTTFDTAKAAGSHAHAMLALAADFNNWQIEQDAKTKQFTIHICRKNETEAHFSLQLEDYEEAETSLTRIYGLIKEHIYTITETEHADKWKFHFLLGYETGNKWLFQSDQEYTSQEEGYQVAAAFYKNIPELLIKKNSDHLFSLVLSETGKRISASLVSGGTNTTVSEESLNLLLKYQKELFQIYKDVSEKRLEKYISSDRKDKESSFLYRLVNTNHVPAKSKFPCPQIDDLNLFKRKLAAAYKQQRWFPHICLGGAIFEEHIDDEGFIRYHFEIRFTNLPFANGLEIPLFTSTTGYQTPEEARMAFLDNYLHILKLASDKTSYGKLISLEPFYLPRADKSQATAALAFIPHDTKVFFEKKFGESWMNEMSMLATAYPLKVTHLGSKDFATLFCKEMPSGERNCHESAVTIPVYYFSFSLKDIPEGLTDQQWISTDYFDTLEKAMQEFLYFNRLLAYSGNWYVDCHFCPVTQQSKLYFYIREILAESTACFSSMDEAWGPQGVEAFICAVQSGKNIHNYARKTDCCYSFYVSCGSNLLTHPCTYDTSSQREDALNELYHRYKKMIDTKAFAIEYDGKNLLLNDKDGKHIARMLTTGNDASCDTVVTIAEIISSKESTWETRDGIQFLTGTDKKITLESLETVELSEWKNILEEWACFFPIQRVANGTILSKDEAGNEYNITRYEYCIEIKIPGFSNCEKASSENPPCHCEENIPASSSSCYIAWKSSCCLDSCEEAFRVLRLGSVLLSDFKNYHAVFDCQCHSFGIALNREELDEQTTPEFMNNIPGQLIARNPQCYQTPLEVCQAVSDTLKLVNSGGMHVVEHILLRPHCQEDCACDSRAQNCNSYANCYFEPYANEMEDPCLPVSPVQFQPGEDPYSFIATVMLPAWPSVFRDPDKREQAEHILYSEAPAHVLLRIIWLRPKDFYYFETDFKEWKKWLAGIPSCTPDFSVCRFLNLVLKKEYTCLPECMVCLPCKDTGIKTTTPCERYNTVTPSAGNPFQFLNHINNIFCMGDYRCDDKIDPDKDKKVPGAATTYQAESVNEQASEKKASSLEHIHPVKPKAKDTKPNYTPKDKAKFINARHNKYLQLAKGVTEQTKGNPTALKTEVFIQNNQPGLDKLEALVKEICLNKKNTSSKSLTKKQLEELVFAAICHYLDSIGFKGMDINKINALSATVKLLKKNKLNALQLYNYWDDNDISSYEPALNKAAIKKIITGK